MRTIVNANSCQVRSQSSRSPGDGRGDQVIVPAGGFEPTDSERSRRARARIDDEHAAQPAAGEEFALPGSRSHAAAVAHVGGSQVAARADIPERHEVAARRGDGDGPAGPGRSRRCRSSSSSRGGLCAAPAGGAAGLPRAARRPEGRGPAPAPRTAWRPRPYRPGPRPDGGCRAGAGRRRASVPAEARRFDCPRNRATAPWSAS